MITAEIILVRQHTGSVLHLDVEIHDVMSQIGIDNEVTAIIMRYPGWDVAAVHYMQGKS